MSLKFILDNTALSKNRNELQNILESLKQKPVPRDFKADFLRRFIIASINTFREKTPEIYHQSQESYHPEIKEIKIHPPEKISVKIKIPEKLRLPLHQFLNTPRKINIPRELMEEAPDKELVETAPEKEL